MDRPRERTDPLRTLFHLPAVARVRDFTALARRWNSERCHSYAKAFQATMPFGEDDFSAGLGRIFYTFGPDSIAVRELRNFLAEMDSSAMENAQRQLVLVMACFVLFGHVKTAEDIPELIGSMLPDIEEARRVALTHKPTYGLSLLGACTFHDEIVLREIVHNFAVGTA